MLLNIKQNSKNEIRPNFKNKTLIQKLLISFPKILIINFKRIAKKENFYNHKIKIPINLEIKNNIENNNNKNDIYKHELTKLINYFGEVHSSHYIVIFK